MTKKLTISIILFTILTTPNLSAQNQVLGLVG